jgi:hypothetical protein
LSCSGVFSMRSVFSQFSHRKRTSGEAENPILTRLVRQLWGLASAARSGRVAPRDRVRTT